MTSTGKWLAPKNAYAIDEEKTAYCYHRTTCNGHCAFQCTVRDGRLVHLEPDNAQDLEYQHCCAKGLSEIEHVYSEDRIQTPLRRVGDRGSGEFESISWDDAMGEIQEKLGAIRDEHGNDAVLFMKTGSQTLNFVMDLIKLQGMYYVDGIDMGLGNGIDAALGGYGFSLATNDSADWVNAKTLIIAGRNYLETSLTQSRHFFNA